MLSPWFLAQFATVALALVSAGGIAITFRGEF